LKDCSHEFPRPRQRHRIKRALGVQAALEWAFRVEQAQLELPLPPDVTEEGFGFGLEYVLLQRACSAARSTAASTRSAATPTRTPR
jgi:hypothetical protein